MTTVQPLKKLILIACSSKKQNLPPNEKVAAIELYTSPLFRHSVNYAKQQIGAAENEIFILSAKHHLLAAHDLVAVYDEYLGKKRQSEKRQWAAQALSQLQDLVAKTGVQEIYVIAGKDYYINLVAQVGEVPVHILCAGLPLGKRMGALKRQDTSVMTNRITQYLK